MPRSSLALQGKLGILGQRASNCFKGLLKCLHLGREGRCCGRWCRKSATKKVPMERLLEDLLQGEAAGQGTEKKPCRAAPGGGRREARSRL